MDYDRSIHHNPDAQAWAKFFIETTEVMDRAAFRDEGYMIAWFSNAMMAMHDHLYKTEIVRLRNDAANEIERLRNNQDAEIELYRKILQQIADEGSGHGQALAYAALKEKE
jgi:hypothetical protein